MNQPKLRRNLLYGFLVLVLISIFTAVQFNPSFDLPLRQADPRICCLILTMPKHFLSRAVAVNQTWAPRCDRYYFISEYSKVPLKENERRVGRQLPIAPIPNIRAGYEHLTLKSALAFLFAYDHHRNDCDWFIKADDDTYVIVDNLRAFLREQNSSEPVTFGYNFRTKVRGGYHSGGAAYVLSGNALKRFHDAYNVVSEQLCARDGGYEDVEIARCLRSQGVYTGKALDKDDRELFHPLSFPDLFSGQVPDWLMSYSENPLRKHYNCCSDRSISFHYMSAWNQYFIDFLLYQVRSPPAYRPGWFKRFNISSRRLLGR